MEAVKVGLISDTHGLLRPQALAAMRGCSHIVHAGDIGRREVLEALEAIAPVTAVAGNNDRAPWAEGIPVTATLEVAGARIFVIKTRGKPGPSGPGRIAPSRQARCCYM